MATQSESDLLAQGVSQAFIDTERGKGKAGLLNGANVDPQDVQGLLSAFRSSGNPYSATNITNTLNNPAAPPDYSDPLGYRARLEAETGLTDVRNRSMAAVDQIRKFDQSSLANQNYLENQTLKMGVITGQQASQARLRGQERTSIVDEANAVQDLLLAKQQEVQDRYGIYEENRNMMTQLILNNPGAKIQYTDKPEAAAAKLQTYAKEVKKEAYKDSLKSIALEYGIKTKGKSTKSLEKAIGKVKKGALKLAQQESELKIEGLKADIALTKAQTAKAGRGGSEDGDKIQGEFDKYVQDVADKVATGAEGYDNRETAFDAIERRFPGEGGIIYRLIPDKKNP
jgi:hypothetical protein